MGRAPDADLCLPEDDVSRFHAALELRGDRVFVVDHGSRNGVYLHGRRVGVAPVQSGSLLRIGQSILWLGPASRFADDLGSLIATEASRRSPLLIVGELGVGRRTIARAIHRRSGHSDPLLTVQHSAPPSIWKAAAGSSLLCEDPVNFDELWNEARAHDVRLLGVASVAPTSTQYPRLVVPALRERLNELPDALAAFFERAGTERTWNADFFEALGCHSFPLNFQELQVLCHGLVEHASPLDITSLPHAVRAQLVEARTAVSDDLSRERLDDALTRHKGNVRRVGQELGVGRGQLYRLFASVGLNPDLYRQTSSRSSSLPSRDERRTIQ